MRIAILAFEGSMLSAISGLADMFWITGQALAASVESNHQPVPHFDTLIISPEGERVRDSQGRDIPVDASFAAAGEFDAILMTGMALDAQRVPLADSAIKAAGPWLRAQYKQGVTLGAACAGGFVLGEAGLLDGKSCTTTWWLHHTLQERYPKARPVWGTSLQEQDRIVTTGGPLSWVELSLHMIRTFAGPEVARLAADMAVADTQPLSQKIYAPPGFINTRHPLLLQAENIIRYKNPAIGAEELASALNISHRTLHRKLKALTNESPKDFITRVRMESACVLLGDRTANIAEVAAQCGYRDDTVFRRAFFQHIGMTPGHYRARVARRE